MAEKLIAHAPRDEETSGIREDLDACADLANCGGRLEDGDRMAGEGERDGGGEASETGADDNDLCGV